MFWLHASVSGLIMMMTLYHCIFMPDLCNFIAYISPPLPYHNTLLHHKPPRDPCYHGIGCAPASWSDQCLQVKNATETSDSQGAASASAAELSALKVSQANLFTLLYIRIFLKQVVARPCGNLSYNALVIIGRSTGHVPIELTEPLCTMEDIDLGQSQSTGKIWSDCPMQEILGKYKVSDDDLQKVVAWKHAWVDI